MKLTSFFSRAIIFCYAFSYAQTALSSAAYIGVHSVDGLARANAGEVALATSASGVSKNPALIMELEGTNLAIGANYVYGDWNGTYEDSPYYNEGEPRGEKTGNFGPRNVALPGIHFTSNMGRWGFGASISTYYGGLLDYDNDDFRFTEVADDTTLLTANTQFDLAYAVTPKLNIGGGIDIAFGYSELNRHFGALATPEILNQPIYGLVDIVGNLQQGSGAIADLLNAQFPDLTGFLDPRKDLFEFRGHSFGAGFHAGLEYEVNEQLIVGMAYRSKLIHHYKGKYESDLPLLPRIYGDLGTAGAEKSAEFDLVQPAMFDAGINYMLNDKWQIHAGVTWQEWSDFQELRVDDDKGDALFTKPTPHKNQFRYAIGASYAYNSDWIFRMGVALDESSATEERTTITLPSSDRYWIGLGFNYKIDETSSVDLAFSYAQNEKINNREKSLIADVVLEKFPDAESLNDALDIINVQFDLGALGDIPINIPLNDLARSFYGGTDPYYDQEIDANLVFVGLQWNKKF